MSHFISRKNNIVEIKTKNKCRGYKNACKLISKAVKVIIAYKSNKLIYEKTGLKKVMMMKKKKGKKYLDVFLLFFLVISLFT